MNERRPSLDYLRAFVTALVVFHHSILAYVTFGRFDATHYLWSTAPIVDSRTWRGFDLVVVFNDSFFMALMFLLAGLFVMPSLRRKGSGTYVRDRLLRLGLPFLLVVVFVMPLAHYPSFRMTGARSGYLEYWLSCVAEGPWPAGPAWFIWVLMVFDAIAALTYWTFGDALVRAASAIARHPLGFLLGAVTVAAIAYIPVLAAVGPTHWFAVGPFAVQASRVGLYASFFAIGIVAGAHGPDGSLLMRQGPLARYWHAWIGLAIVMFSLLLGLQVGGRGSGSFFAAAFVASCTASCMGLLGVFIRFVNERRRGLDAGAVAAYGIYLVHYPFVLWTQYLLLASPFPAVAKAAIVFGVAIAASWGVVAALRRIPFVARIV